MKNVTIKTNLREKNFLYRVGEYFATDGNRNEVNIIINKKYIHYICMCNFWKNEDK